MVFKDRVKQVTTTEGAGVYAVSTSFVGFQDFTEFIDGDETCYCCEDGVDWEVGIGTVGGGGSTVTRDEILASSNGGAAVSWLAGSRIIYCVYPSKYVFASVGGLLQSYSEKVVECNDGQIDIDEANVFKMTPTSPVTVAFSGEMISGQCHSLTLHIINGDSNAVTWPASVSFVGGSEYAATAHDIVILHTIDGGTNWYLSYSGAI